MTDINACIRLLAERTGTDFRLDEEGYAVFHDGTRGMLFRWIEEAGEFVIHAETGRPSAEALLPALTDLLASNFLFLGTGGGIAGYDPGSGNATLSFRIRATGLTPEEFTDRVLEALDEIEKWTVRIEGYERNVHAPGGTAAFPASDPAWQGGMDSSGDFIGMLRV